LVPEEVPGRDQAAIWDYFQTQGAHSFAGSRARLAYLSDRVASAGPVLNVGVGGGIFEEEAIRRGIDVFSLDPSQAAVEALRTRLGLGDRAQVGDINSLPFNDGQFGTAVVSEVLEHLPDDALTGAVAELARVLRPAGQLLVTVPADEDLRANLVVCPCCATQFHRWGHLQSFTDERLRKLLAPSFMVRRVTRRVFASNSDLNWKGRAVHRVRGAARLVGVHGSSETLVLTATRAVGT
jgi:SAM-dependent methyltransferase